MPLRPKCAGRPHESPDPGQTRASPAPVPSPARLLPSPFFRCRRLGHFVRFAASRPVHANSVDLVVETSLHLRRNFRHCCLPACPPASRCLGAQLWPAIRDALTGPRAWCSNAPAAVRRARLWARVWRGSGAGLARVWRGSEPPPKAAGLPPAALTAARDRSEPGAGQARFQGTPSVGMATQRRSSRLCQAVIGDW